MKAVAVFFLMLGILAMFSWSLSPERPDTLARDTAAVATNYAVYRNQVFRHVLDNPQTVGVVPEADLPLPAYWNPVRTWKHRIEPDGRCYVYGPASSEEVAAVIDILHGSFAVGRKGGGVLVPGHGKSIPLPDFIPEDSVVSVMEVCP